MKENPSCMNPMFVCFLLFDSVILYESNVCMLFVWFSSWAAAFSELNPWLRSILCCIFYVKSSDSFFFQCLELSVFFFFSLVGI